MKKDDIKMRLKTAERLRAMLLPMIAAGLVAASVGEAAAQGAATFPSRPITIIVPYGPGASNDLFTRALARIMGPKIGQPIVVENRAGAGGFVGANFVSGSAPDGYTLLESASGIATIPRVQGQDFDPIRHLTPLARLAVSPNAMVIPASLPVTTVPEFIEYAKKNPDTTFYGTTGFGGTQQLHAEQFNLLAGTKMKPVVYKASAEAQTDLVAGRLHVMFATMASVLGQVQSGQLRHLGYTAAGAPSSAPKAPTMEELGLKGFAGQIWWGIFAPPGLPKDIRDKLNAAINESIMDPEFVKLLDASGASPATMNADEFTQVVKKEMDDLEKLVRAANIKFQ